MPIKYYLNSEGEIPEGIGIPRAFGNRSIRDFVREELGADAHEYHLLIVDDTSWKAKGMQVALEPEGLKGITTVVTEYGEDIATLQKSVLAEFRALAKAEKNLVVLMDYNVHGVQCKIKGPDYIARMRQIAAQYGKS